MGVSVAIGVGIGAVVGGTAAAIQSGGNFNAIWKGALVGAVGGAVGGWAAPALVGTLGTVGAGMAAGALGGVTSGVLGTALNGGTGDDYLKAGLFGGLGGAAVGGVTAGLGEAFGGQAASMDSSGNMVTGTPYTSDVTGATTPLTDAGASTLTTAPTASGVGGTGIDASGAVQSTITGVPQAAPTPTLNVDASGIPLTSSGQYAFDDAVQNIPMGTQQSFNNAELSNLGQYIGAENANPTVNAGNTADPFEMGKAWSQPTSQVEAQLKPYAAENAAQNELMWKGGNNNQPGFFDTLFSKKTGGDMLGKVLMGNMMGNALKGAGSIMGMNEARQNQNQLMDLYNAQRNQYNMQNAAANQYQQQLQDTYSNPNEYLNSPEAVAARQQAMQKLLAQNAMAGRRTAGLPMQNQLMMNQLSNLNQYRQGLGTAARGAYASPTGLGTTLSAAQAQSPTGNLMAGLGSIFAPAATYYMMG